MAAAAARSPTRGAGSLTDDCVHCGFCLPACPTWHSWAEEMDSPRGRIDLMRGLAEGKLEWTRRRGEALRPVPRLPRLRPRLPLRRAIRRPHRADAGPPERRSRRGAS